MCQKHHGAGCPVFCIASRPAKCDVCLSLIKLSSLEPRFMCPLKRNSSTSGDVAFMFMLSVEYSYIL